MTLKSIAETEAECRRFLDRAIRLRAHVAREEAELNHEWRPGGVLPGSKQSGALRRASMDLTRALADLRR